MGCGVSKSAGQKLVETGINGVQNQAQKNRQIEQQLAQEKLAQKKLMKILLLGGPACGKSTIFKQMKILHLNGFTDSDLLHYRTLIHANVVQSVEQLLDGCRLLKIELDVTVEEEAPIFEKFSDANTNLSGVVLDDEIVGCISRIWHSNSVQECYERRNEIQLLDSTKYFLDDLARVSNAQYVPTNDDVLRSRIATTGIHQMEFRFKHAVLNMVDVGGQKSEQRKWIHCFDDVHAILFIVDISGYDLMMEENEEENRLQNSLELFERISSLQFFEKTSIILFLNKIDCFIDKLATSPLKRCFAEYDGPDEYDDASAFVQQQFRSLAPQGKSIYTHFTTATSTENVAKVFNASMDILLKKKMAQTGLA